MWSPIIQLWVLVPKGLAGNRLCYFLLSCGNVMWGLWWLIVLPWLHMQQACNGYRPLICWAGWNRVLFTPWLHHLQRWLLVRRVPVFIWEQPWGPLNKDWIYFYKISKRKTKIRKNKNRTYIFIPHIPPYLNVNNKKQYQEIKSKYPICWKIRIHYDIIFV